MSKGCGELSVNRDTQVVFPMGKVNVLVKRYSLDFFMLPLIVHMDLYGKTCLPILQHWLL